MTEKTRTAQRDAGQSPLMVHSNRELTVKILAELRVQTLLMAQGFGIADDVSALRDEAMAYANKTFTDI